MTADETFYLYAQPDSKATEKDVRKWISQMAADLAAAENLDVASLSPDDKGPPILTLPDGSETVAFLVIKCGGKGAPPIGDPMQAVAARFLREE